MEKLNILAKTIVNHSLKVKKDNRVLITYQDINCKNLIQEIVKEVIQVGGVVSLEYVDQDINNYIGEHITNSIINEKVNRFKYNVENYDCFIRIYYRTSDFFDKNMNKSLKNKLLEKMKPYREVQINKKRWVLLNYPSLVDAYKAHMTPEEFSNFAFSTMTVDYSKMYHDLLPLKQLMDKTNKVRILGPNTDISFSIKGMKSVICAGECNIPDGECFTAPIKNSVNGKISYNVSSPYEGELFQNITLVFKNGQIIDFSSSNNKKMEEIFNTDKGARYIGEFSLGVNPLIKEPMGDILYDEKIAGSLHFTPGCAYDECNNGNKSNIHWDLVLIQRPEYGGGSIYFDDKLIRKDGLFLIDELKNLNYK